MFMLTRFGLRVKKEATPRCARKPLRCQVISIESNLPEDDPRNLTPFTRLLGLMVEYPIEDYPMGNVTRILG